MRADALLASLPASTGRPIVCAQAGNVNTGACDPLPESSRRSASCRRAGCTSTARSGCGPRSRPASAISSAGRRARRLVVHRRPQVAQRPVRLGLRDRRRRGRPSRGDDARRRVPTRRRRRRARSVRLGRRVVAAGARVPDLRGAPLARSRRRGRDGRALLRARPAMAAGLRDAHGIDVLNDVVLNQVLAGSRSRRAARRTTSAIDAPPAVIAAVQEDGTCWLGGTTWQDGGDADLGLELATTEADADLSVAAIRRCAAQVAAGRYRRCSRLSAISPGGRPRPASCGAARSRAPGGPCRSRAASRCVAERLPDRDVREDLGERGRAAAGSSRCRRWR